MNNEDVQALQTTLRQQQHDLAQQHERLFALELELQRSMHIYEEQAQWYRRANTERMRRLHSLFSRSQSNATSTLNSKRSSSTCWRAHEERCCRLASLPSRSSQKEPSSRSI